MKYGAIAQLVARLNGIEKVSGSNPLSSIQRFSFLESLVRNWKPIFSVHSQFIYIRELSVATDKDA